VGATDNIRKRAEEPNLYFERLANAGVDLRKHLIVSAYASNPANLNMDMQIYLHFRDARTDEIYKILEPKINFN
jgi:hypothetical protein